MIRTFFGSPGVGKTTLCCKLAKKNRKIYKRTFCNFSNTVPGCGSADLDGLGLWTFPHGSYIAIDEAGIEYNSRAYKALPRSTIAWFKKHRHYRCDVDVFSQSWDDMDVTIRRLSNELWYMYRVGPFTLCRRVYKRVTVDKNTQQIIDGYKMANILWLLIWPLQLGWPFDKKWTLTFRPFYYRYFDSWETDSGVPIKDFSIKKPLREWGSRRHDRRPTNERKGIRMSLASLAVFMRSCFDHIKTTFEIICSFVLMQYFKIQKKFNDK